ncbi:MAG: CinA family protein [Desulfovibrionaceae bacterium]
MEELVKELGKHMCERGWKLATAESCTGGLVAVRCTDVPGSSAWFAGSVVAYCNNIKLSLLGVAGDVLKRLGAVSREVAESMAEQVLTTIGAHVSVAISGIAGPDGGTEDKPVGTVWIAWATYDEVMRSEVFHFEGDRAAIREQAARAAIEGLLALVR